MLNARVTLLLSYKIWGQTVNMEIYHFNMKLSILTLIYQYTKSAEADFVTKLKLLDVWIDVPHTKVSTRTTIAPLKAAKMKG